MNDFLNTVELDDKQIAKRTTEILQAPFDYTGLPSVYADILGMIDLTTLEGADTDDKVRKLCRKAHSFHGLGKGLPNVAAVCVYPTLVGVARKELLGSGIRVASVAGAFPAGQSPLFVKVAEVSYALDQGAEEIDMVISRGKFLEGEYNLVFDEIAAILDVCGDAHLKVILETGELKTATNIRRASEIAMRAGAHFIKTSTGKFPVAATPEAMLVMLEAISDHHERTGRKVGIKPAGGIADPETALIYYRLTDSILGKDWLQKDLLRFGASRLADGLVEAMG
jgi:deoxyribose-phosphate aldolase